CRRSLSYSKARINKGRGRRRRRDVRSARWLSGIASPCRPHERGHTCGCTVPQHRVQTYACSNRRGSAEREQVAANQRLKLTGAAILAFRLQRPCRRPRLLSCFVRPGPFNSRHIGRGSPMNYAETMLPEFDREMANTRKVLERVPENQLD